MAKEDIITSHLFRTLNATRQELKDLVRITKDEEFDALMAEVIQGCSQLRVRNVGTDNEWYYLLPGLTKGKASDLLAAVIGDR
jgi:hypothetical protein